MKTSLKTKILLTFLFYKNIALVFLIFVHQNSDLKEKLFSMIYTYQFISNVFQSIIEFVYSLIFKDVDGNKMCIVML